MGEWVFLALQTFEDFAKLPQLSPFFSGFLAVDGFYILTGFLLAFPLFSHEIKQQMDSGKLQKTPGVFDQWYRRLSRIVPVYSIVVLIYCFAIFPSGLFAIEVLFFF